MFVYPYCQILSDLCVIIHMTNINTNNSNQSKKCNAITQDQECVNNFKGHPFYCWHREVVNTLSALDNSSSPHHSSHNVISPSSQQQRHHDHQQQRIKHLTNEIPAAAYLDTLIGPVLLYIWSHQLSLDMRIQYGAKYTHCSLYLYID